MSLKSLSIATALLLGLSIFVYLNENHRGTDLISGSEYIKGLDVGKIEKIVLSFKDEKKITLSRDSDRFVLEDHSSYPAATDKVNELIYSIASIQVKEKVSAGASEEELDGYELSDKTRKYLVEMFDNDGKKTVAFSVGKSKKGKGNYLLKQGQKEVYLSQESLWIDSSYKDFINTALLSISKDDIARVSLSKDSVEFFKNDSEFSKGEQETREFKPEKFDEYAAGLTSVNFQEFFPHSESKVSNLSFDQDVKIQLKNKLVYRVSLAKSEEDYFVKLNALVEDLPEKIVVREDDSQEKIAEIEDMVKAKTEASRINGEKGQWVYKIDKSVYEKIAKDSSFFM